MKKENKKNDFDITLEDKLFQEETVVTNPEKDLNKDKLWN